MTRSKLVAATVYLGAVVIGAAAGIAVDRKLVRDPMVPPTREEARARFFADLRFTAEQRVAWDSISQGGRRADSLFRVSIRVLQDSLLAPARSRLDAMRARQDSTWKARDAALRALLTPEQLKLLDARRQRSNDSRR
jgi:hypothetical protein